MKFFIDRNICDHTLPVCEACLGRLLRFPMGEDRPCITAIEFDDDEEVTLIIKSDGHETILTLDEKMREIAALEGFSAFLPWKPAIYSAP